jgi:hypothetical protein
MTGHRWAEHMSSAAGAIAWCTCGASFFARYLDCPPLNQETSEQRQAALQAAGDLLKTHIAEAEQGSAQLPSAAEAVIVRPGDTLVIRIDQRLSGQEIDELQAHLGGQMPGVKVVVLDGVAQLLVYRPGGVCGRELRAPIGDRLHVCELTPGHDGRHESDGVSWLYNAPEPEQAVA